MRPFSPFDSEMFANPYPTYARYRSEEPVHWGVAGDPNFAGTWYLFRHGDIVAALGDRRLGREVRRVVPPGTIPEPPEAYRPLFQAADQWMILRDPPTHTRLRALVQKAFTPRMVRRVLPRIAALTDELIDRFVDGRADLINDFARLVPLLVIAEILGVPVEDYPVFVPWAMTLASTIEFRQSDEVYRRGTDAIVGLTNYLRSLIHRRQQWSEDELIGALLTVEIAGQRLSEEDVIGNISMLLTAGNDPTMHLIGNGVNALLRHPDQLDRLRREPGLIETAIDELLRYDSSVQMTFRYALEPVEYGGRSIRTGEQVAIVFGSALRDPDYCDNPDMLDLARENNRLPFGLGIHFCLGSALARSEGQIALNRLLARLPTFRLADNADLQWQETVAVHGLKALPVEFGL